MVVFMLTNPKRKLGQGDIWGTADHPNQKKYPGQKLYFVVIDDYVYIVPYVIEESYIFLKTIIPSRKATKDYFRTVGKDHEAR